MDPNLRHWRDRLDNLQWVVRSTLLQADSIPS